MDLDAQKLVVRQFYEEHHDNLYEMVVCGRNKGFSRPKDFAPPFERVASVTLPELNPLEVIFERISQNVPQSVSNAFDRHLWYSQWSFAELFLIKILIDKQSFFFLYRSGIRDSYTNSVEIYNEQGQFIDAPPSDHGIWNIKWREKPFTHEDCRTDKTGAPPPPWPEDDPYGVSHDEPWWTEEMLIREGAEIEEEGSVTRYVYVWH
jgi:hypothetical protein